MEPNFRTTWTWVKDGSLIDVGLHNSGQPFLISPPRWIFNYPSDDPTRYVDLKLNLKNVRTISCMPYEIVPAVLGTINGYVHIYISHALNGYKACLLDKCV